MPADDIDRNCPECGGFDTVPVELERLPHLQEGVYEMLSCNDCYAGFRILYEPSGKELTHEPESCGA